MSEKLLLSEIDLHSTLDAMFSFIAIVDVNGDLVFVNKKARDYLEFDIEDMYGIPFWSCPCFQSDSETESIIQDSIYSAIKGKVVRRKINVYCKKRPVPLSVLCTASPVSNRHGMVCAVVFEGTFDFELEQDKDAAMYERKAFQIIADAAVNASDINDLCKRVLFGLVRAMGFDRGNIRLYDRKSEMLNPCAIFDESSETQVWWVRPHNIHDTHFISSLTAKKRIALFAPDITVHDIYSRFKGNLDRWKIGSFISWPIVDSEDNLIGVMQLLDKSVKSGFSYEDQSFFETVASMFAHVLEHKIAEERIARSLKEKDLLLKEIHHRVKNNLQVISSMLSLQLNNGQHRDFRELVRESQNRVKSMAMIHDALYRSLNLSAIDFGSYLKELSSYLLSSYGVSEHRVMVIVNAEGVILDIDQAIPCGLIVNELISNALKHAFPGGLTGRICVEFYKVATCEYEYMLRVSDDGIGLPDGLDLDRSRSFGIQLVSMLTKQIGGTWSVVHDKDKGTSFEIRLKIP